VDLAPGEERDVAFKLPLRAFEYYDTRWRREPGAHELRAASSSRDIRLRATVTLP
jgi:hypothetical protein